MTQSEVDDFFSTGGAPAPERVNGRYKLPDPHTGEERSYQTASNYAYPLADQYGLTKWRHRQLLIGLARRPDLIAMLSTMGTAAGEDNGKLDEITQTAMSVAGTDVKTNRGTAIHEALRAADESRPYPGEFEPFVTSYRAELVRYGLTVGLVERLVMAPGFGACGRLDRTFIEADGTHVLGDIKSTGRLELQSHEISVQLKIYQSGSHMRSADGKAWEPIPRGKHPLRDDYAIVVHVDQETASVALYRLDLRIGGIGAQLAEQVRGWRKSGPVLLPYVPPITPMRQGGGSPATVEQIKRVSGANPDPAGGPGTSIPTPAESAAPPAPDPRGPVPEPDEVFGGPTVTGPPDPFDQQPSALTHGTTPERPAAPLLPAAVLVTKTKAQVQQYCRDHGITEDLAHTKAKLLEKLNAKNLLAHGMGGQMRAEPTLHPAQTEAFRSMTLSKIGNASTVGELQTINADVRRLGGDQAWTDEMTEAARVRVGQLDSVNAAPLPNPVLTEIGQAQSSQDLAKIWERVTVGGSVSGSWTPAVHQASVARLAEINATRPPAPENPFGP